MDLTTLPLVWAQAQPAGASSGAMAFLALRRWCSSLTLSSPQLAPNLTALWLLLLALLAVLVLAFLFQGPVRALKQLFDVVGHVRLVQRGTRRVWRAGRLVSAAIGFTVLGWTAIQAITFERPVGKSDLLLLTRTRGLGEIALEQGIFAGLTPLRDVVGLGDNLAMLVVAAVLVFRASMEPPPLGYGTGGARARPRTGWLTVVWGSASLYALYRIVSRLAGSIDLPMAGGPVVVAVFIPLLMVLADGALLAWVLVELRRAGFDDAGEDRLDVRQATALLPAAALACVLAMPARYVATLLWLGSAYLSTSVYAAWPGEFVRWQLGWGLTFLQAAALVAVGTTGVVAWGRGTLKGAVVGYARLLSAEGGHLVGALALAAAAAGILAAPAYAVLLLLPAQTWVLAAADSYSHFATLPVGLWTLAAFVELAERSLPAASLARSAPRQAETEVFTQLERESHHDALPPVGAPTA